MQHQASPAVACPSCQTLGLGNSAVDYAPFLIFALLGLFALALLWAAVALLARSAGVLVGLVTKSNPRSPAYVRAVTNLAYAGLVSFIGYHAYRALYPADDFYFAEFETVASRKPPREARIIAKDATYPDFHGDYCSFSRIEVSRQSFHQLLEELSTDRRMTPSGGNHVSEGAFLRMKLPPLRVMKSFARNDSKSDHHYSIAFLENESEIEVQVCVT